MPLRSMISGALGLHRRRLWSLENGESSSLSVACLLLLRNPCRRSISQSSSSAAAADPPPSISVAFLVDSCGLSPDSAAASIRKLNLKGNPKAFRNPEAVLELFRSRGFSGAQIARIVALQPRVLVSDAERTLKPKIDYLRAEGFSQNDMMKFVSSFSVMLYGSLEKRIKPNFDVLRTFLPSGSGIVASATRSHWLLTTDLKKTMLPNSETLRAIGVPAERISQLIVLDAKVLARAPRRFDEYIEFLKEIGLSPTTYRYIRALIALSGLSRATLQKKISFYRNLGITEEDLFSALSMAPNILGLSEENIKRTFNLFKGFGLRDDEISSFFGKRAPALFMLSEQNISKSMDFLVRALDCKPRDVLLRPVLLTLSLERRLIPRDFVRTTLLSKGLLRGDKVHFGIFRIKEDKFVGSYLIKFRNELPQLLEDYEKLKVKGVRSSVCTETSV